MTAKPLRLSTLFLSVLKISAFTFGGGYVIVPLMRKRFSEDLQWVKEEEMLDMIAIAQSAPGPIAVNTSIILGYRLLGIKGALASVLGTAIPPLLVLTLISMFYEAFRANRWIAALLGAMRAGVAAVIVDVVWTMAANITKKRKATPIILMIAAFIAVFIFKVNIILVLLFCGFLGFLDAMRSSLKEAKP
ncbi:MAG: chromate transporter [Clostridiales bacterium]|nr:chromate transporter [Clostridiales bacterium]